MTLNLDKFDFIILRELQQNASQPIAELAEKASLSKSACWRRLKTLHQKGVISQTVALLNAQKLDLSLMVYISIRTNQHNDIWVQKFKSNIENIEGVLEVYRMSGDLDYLVKAVVKDMPDYDRLYKKMLNADIYDISSSFVMETIKYSTALPLTAR